MGKMHVTTAEVEQLLDNIELQNVSQIVAISRGGLVPARYIAKKLGIRRIYTLGIEFYDDSDSKMKIPYVYQKLTNEFPEDVSVLIIDDIADSGETFKIAIKEVRDAGAKHIETLSVHYKPKSAYKPTYIGREVSNDCWVIFPWE